MSLPGPEATLTIRPPAWLELARNRNVRWGLLLIGLLALMALLAPLLPLHDPTKQYPDGLDDDGMPVPPSAQFWLGTDSMGRDVFSRLWHGARISLSVGTVAMLTATVIGALIGLLAGYGWRWLDVVLMRLTDIMLALPAMLLAIALAGIIAANKEPPPQPEGAATNDAEEESTLEQWWEELKPQLRPRQGLLTLSMVIAVVSWTGMARVVRAQVLTLKERDFVHAARALGCSPARFLFRHILPNVLPTIIVLATLSTAGTIGLEAGLSFLGIGIPPPTPSWGSMVNDGQAFMLVAPWLVLPPSLGIILAVFGFNLLGQGLQDVLDPYQKKGLCKMLGNQGRLGLLLGLVVLSGCGAPPLPSPPTEDTLRLAMHTDVHSLDPAINYEAYGMTFVRLLYESLLDYGDGTDLVPWLAEKVPVPSDDGKTYTLSIKKDVHFTNGRELVAEDFVYSLERILDPKTRSPGDKNYRNILGAEAFQKARNQEADEAKDDEAKRERRQKGERWVEPIHVEGLQAVDPHTLTIQLEKADPTFLYVLTMPFSAPVPRETVEKYGEEFASHPDGTGPYVLTEWQRGQRLSFEHKGAHHMHQEKFIQRIEVMIGPDDLTTQMMFERGQVDLSYILPSPDFVRITNDPHWKTCVGSSPTMETDYLALNCELSPFTDRRVRQAINYAINKQRILKLNNYRATLAVGILPPLLPGYNPAVKGYPFDPEKAKRLLAEAGYPHGFKMSLWFPSDNDVAEKMAMSIQQDLHAVGIDVELKKVAYAVFDEATGKRKEVPASIFGWSVDYPDPSNFLDALFNGDSISDTHCNNIAFYSNPEVNDLLKKASEETADPGRRLRLYQDIEAKIMEDAPWVPLYHPIDYRLVQPWVKGYKMHVVWTVRYEKLWIERP